MYEKIIILKCYILLYEASYTITLPRSTLKKIKTKYSINGKQRSLNILINKNLKQFHCFLKLIAFLMVLTGALCIS